jgi:glycosyltransferase involved in cell wall biosynthesis
MTLLTIIIPVFNAQDYICDALNSVLIGIPEEVEVIIINDGSTDNSSEVIRKSFYSEIQSGQLVFLEQINSGVSVARNLGIECSTGEYIGFLDADDMIINEYYPLVLSAIKKRSDIIEFGFKRFSQSSDLLLNESIFTHDSFGFKKTSLVIGNIFSNSLFYSGVRVIRKSILQDIRFPVGVNFCEDMMFFYEVYEASDSIYHINEALYGYRNNALGATRNVKLEYLKHLIRFYKFLVEIDTEHVLYLKVNIIFVLQRCSNKLGILLLLPINVFIDSKKTLFKLALSGKIPLSKKFILFSPNIFSLLKYCKSIFKTAAELRDSKQ